jgi:hypothetical protein
VKIKFVTESKFPGYEIPGRIYSRIMTKKASDLIVAQLNYEKRNSTLIGFLFY